MRYEVEKVRVTPGSGETERMRTFFFFFLYFSCFRLYSFISRNTVFYPVQPKQVGMGQYLNWNETTTFLYGRRCRSGKYRLYRPVRYKINFFSQESCNLIDTFRYTKCFGVQEESVLREAIVFSYGVSVRGQIAKIDKSLTI